MVESKSNDAIQLFEDRQIRTAWDEEKEEWYFSIVDVIEVLTDSPNPQTYWRVMKKRLKDEGNETVTNCNALKMTAADGKKRLTDVANTELLLRIIQSAGIVRMTCMNWLYPKKGLFERILSEASAATVAAKALAPRMLAG